MTTVKKLVEWAAKQENVMRDTKMTNIGLWMSFCVFCGQGEYSTPSHKPGCLHVLALEKYENKT